MGVSANVFAEQSRTAGRGLLCSIVVGWDAASLETYCGLRNVAKDPRFGRILWHHPVTKTNGRILYRARPLT